MRVHSLDSLVIHRHEQEVFFEDVHVARPRLHPLVPPLPLTAELTQGSHIVYVTQLSAGAK